MSAYESFLAGKLMFAQPTGIEREVDLSSCLAPLQLPIIERAINLWTKADDLVFSPFAGIGSEGFVALKHKRRFVGAELKRSYWTQAKANLATAETMATERDLFSVE